MIRLVCYKLCLKLQTHKKKSIEKNIIQNDEHQNMGDFKTHETTCSKIYMTDLLPRTNGKKKLLASNTVRTVLTKNWVFTIIKATNPNEIDPPSVR